MSIFSDIFSDILALIYPDRCIVCDDLVDRGVHSICVKCRYEIPLTGYCYLKDNPVKEYFDTLIPNEHCSSMLFFKTESKWREVVHKFKYKGKCAIAYHLGRWYGLELKASGFYDGVDTIVPVPLHWTRTIVRGYNQCHYIAQGIADEMGVKVERGCLYRKRNNPSQTTQSNTQRWENVDGIFAVRNAKRLNNHHILIVDDVLTTGATLNSCAKAILQAAPSCKISIATLAVAGRLARHL